MKRKAFLQTACTLTAVLLLAAACTQNELSGGKGETLPEGKYPMTFATTVEGVTATRATTDNSWAGGEDVAVQVRTANPKKYTAATDGKLSAATDETPFYWESTTEEKKVSAWYPYTATKPTSFSVKKDQSGTDGTDGTDGYQASDLIYAASQKVAYSGSKELTFKHLPVKVVVNLKAGTGVTANEVTSASVTIINQSLTSGAITEGTTSTDATTGGTTTADWSVAQAVTGNTAITPKTVTPAATDCQKSVQALLVPQQMKDLRFIKVTAGGNDYYYIPTNETDANLRAGQQYIYTITVTKNGLTVTASGAAEWTGTEKEATNKVPETDFSATDLKVGDYFYSDGTWSDGGYRKYTDGTTATLPIMPVLTDANGNARTVSGIVLHLRNESSVTDNCNYESFTGVPTGYVLSIDEAETKWGTTDGTECEYNNEIFGYAHTKLFYAKKPEMTTTAIDWCKNHDINAPVSPPSSVAVSTWYMPSQQELKMITTDLRPVLDAILSRITGGTPFQNKYYFTSGLMGRIGGYVWMYNPITGSDDAGNYNNDASWVYPYRAMFAFQLKTPVSKQNHR